MLMIKLLPIPALKNTANGGKKMHKISNIIGFFIKVLLNDV